MSTHQMPESEQFLLDEIKEYTKDTHSDNYYIGKIKQLGKGLIREVLSETKYKHRLGDIKKTPKEYLTYLLEQEIKNNKISLFKASSKPTKTISTKQTNQFNFFNILTTTEEMDKSVNVLSNEKSLTSPKKLDKFLKVLFLTSSRFFTQATNPKKTEKTVLMTFTTEKGEKKDLILVKGKAFEEGEIRGILKAFHNRVLYALTGIWEEHGKQYAESSNHKIKICFCDVSVKELANILGFKGLGGRQFVKIKRAVDDLRAVPFYFDFSEFNGEIKTRTFNFLQTAIFSKYMKDNIPATIRIEFSQLYSNMLFEEQTVRRNKSLCKIEDSLAFFLIDFIEPILVMQGSFNTALATLIKSLNLQKADWHNFKSTRKRQFKKATDKLEFMQLSDRSTIASVGYCLNKDKSDYIVEITTNKA